MHSVMIVRPFPIDKQKRRTVSWMFAIMPIVLAFGMFGDKSLTVRQDSFSSIGLESRIDSSSAILSSTDTFYVSPNASGEACTKAHPCPLLTAQEEVRKKLASGRSRHIEVLLADGIYRLRAPLQFEAEDSGLPGSPVVWRAQSGAHPILSGAGRVTGWKEVDKSQHLWAAKVPLGSNTRQIYIDGHEAPIAQASSEELGFRSLWKVTPTGYALSPNSAEAVWFATLSASQAADVEFDYLLEDPPFTEWRCRVKSVAGSGTTIEMAQPCWDNLTKRPKKFNNQSGGLPTLMTASSTQPTTIQNARNLLHPGQWYLDRNSHTLYYRPKVGEVVENLDIELPRLEALLEGAGSLSKPLHDVAFRDLEFSGATWNAPSTGTGFIDIQGNLLVTAAPNQGMCNEVNPPGSCPWAGLDMPRASVSFTASNNILLAGNRFTDLGSVGLAFAYGSSHNLIQGNIFDTIAASAIRIGCSYDGTPEETSGDIIKRGCTGDPASEADDVVGSNEIMTWNTVDNNLIHDTGIDYQGSAAITLLFSQHTSITHNDIFNVPYDGITAGILQGHVDNVLHPDESTNINADNVISFNLIHDYLQSRWDGGAIYIEGHQSISIYQNDGKSIDSDATRMHGLLVANNVVFNQGKAPHHRVYFSYYDDAGTEWITFRNNVQFGPLDPEGGSQGGCQAIGHIWVTDNYLAGKTGLFNGYDAQSGFAPGTRSIDTHISGTVVVLPWPKPGDIPENLLRDAGLAPEFRSLETSLGPTITLVPPLESSDPVLLAGEGFSPQTRIEFGNHQAAEVQYISQGFLVAFPPVLRDDSAGSVRALTAESSANPGARY
jgi:hypothetical protein